MGLLYMGMLYMGLLYMGLLYGGLTRRPWCETVARRP